AYWPEGRNTGAWEASEEAWRFSPNGFLHSNPIWYVLDESDPDPNNHVFVEVENAGPQDGAHTRSFTFTEPETTIKFKVEYNLCETFRGGTVDDEFELVVFTNDSFTVDLGPDISTCDAESVTLTPTIYDENGDEIPATDYDQFDFLWSPGA